MKVKKILRNLLILVLLIVNIGCDQLSKSIVRQNIDYYEYINVIDNFVILTKVENTGAFLGLGDSLPRMIYIILMIILPLVVLGYTLYYLLTKNNLPKMAILGICLIIGGGLGNIYDRIIYGSVTDFLQINFVLFKTGIVNIADVSVTTGLFIILYEVAIHRGNLNFKTSE